MKKENKQKKSEWELIFWSLVCIKHLFLYSFIFLMAIYGVLDVYSSFKMAFGIMVLYGYIVMVVTSMSVMIYFMSKKLERSSKT